MRNARKYGRLHQKKNKFKQRYLNIKTTNPIRIER